MDFFCPRYIGQKRFIKSVVPRAVWEGGFAHGFVAVSASRDVVRCTGVAASAVAASYENKVLFLQCPVPQSWLQPETTRKMRCLDVWLFSARVPLSRLLGVRPDSLRTHHLFLSSLTCVCQFPVSHGRAVLESPRLTPSPLWCAAVMFSGSVAVRSTRGRGEVVGDQVALRALGGSWSAARARQKGAGDPLSIPVYVPIHSSHVRSKVQTNQMLCEQQHFCLKPGVVCRCPVVLRLVYDSTL